MSTSEEALKQQLKDERTGFAIVVNKLDTEKKRLESELEAKDRLIRKLSSSGSGTDSNTNNNMADNNTVNNSGNEEDTTTSNLSILICSANIGNAEPTPESFSQWVPPNGIINPTISSTKYPVDALTTDSLANNVKELTSSSSDVINTLKSQQSKQFDIICLGMQEAAFVEPKQPSLKRKDSQGNSTHNVELNKLDTSGSKATTTDINERSEKDTAIPGIPVLQTGVQPVDETIQQINDGIVKIEKESKKGSNKLFRKAVKANMIVRGLTTSQSFYKSPSVRAHAKDAKVQEGFKSGSYDTRKFLELIENQCPSYRMVTARLRGEMRLIILVRDELESEVENVYVAGENTGIGGVMANKGGIIATFDIRGTRLSFMTCHLEAHEGENHYKNRNSNLAEIFQGAKTDPNYNLHDATIISHHMFVCGDLNYRIKLDTGDETGGDGDKKKDLKKSKTKRVVGKVKKSISGKASRNSMSKGSERDGDDILNMSTEDINAGYPSAAVSSPTAAANGEEEKTAHEIHFEKAKELVDAEDWKTLNDGDELASALTKKECLAEFTTLPCNFPPTFKVARCEGYEYNEKRTPSYTDRILWKSADGLKDNIVPFLYEPCPEFITSDHKPIRGGYSVKTNTGPPQQAQSIQKMDSDKHNERQVHLLISDIKCTNLPVMDNEIMGGLSDPYILFVSSPKPILWKKAWPSTKVIKRELNPVWKEDMHLMLDHDSCLDASGDMSLVGSMLFMTVMDEDFSSGDDVIGTVALSMNELCSELEMKQNKKSFKDSVSSTVTATSNPVQQTVISRPILRNGLEFGMLECTISAAYLNAKETKAFLKRAKKVRSKTRGETLTNKIFGKLPPLIRF